MLQLYFLSVKIYILHTERYNFRQVLMVVIGAMVKAKILNIDAFEIGITLFFFTKVM